MLLKEKKELFYMKRCFFLNLDLLSMESTNYP
jgi:hypothetical protein